MMRRFPRILLGAVLVGLLIISCGEDPVSPDVSGEPKIPSTTKVVSEDAVKSVVGDTYTLYKTQVDKQLQVNDILVSEHGLGVLRKITSIDETSSTLIVETASASITDAIERCDVQVSDELRPSDVRHMLEGVSVRGLGSKTGEFFVEISDVVIYDDDGEMSTTNDQITLNGELTLEPSFDFRMKIDGYRLKELEITGTLEQSLEVTAEASFSFLEVDEKREIMSFDLHPIIIWVGWVPIVITPELAIVVGFQGEVYVSLSAGVHEEATYTAGLRYRSGTWEPINEHAFDFQCVPPQLSAGCAAKGYAGPQLNFLIYGVAGPYVIGRGFVELEADVMANPWWTLYGGIEAAVGVRLEIFDRDIADYEIPAVIGYRAILLQAPGAPTGHISGMVKDALTLNPLPYATITVKEGSTTRATGQTDLSGQYSFSVPFGSGYKVTVTKSGYISEDYCDIDVGIGGTTYLETILQIDTAHSGAGSVRGRIVNAMTGYGVPAVSLGLRRGINVTTGSVVATTSTDSEGDYYIFGLPAGNYTAEASKAGYNTTFFTVTCLGGTLRDNQNASITPEISEGEVRIVLTWGESPNDLDSHLTGPLSDGTRFHMYYPLAEANSGSPWPSVVTLDRDDTDSYGPETVTLYEQLVGIYRYSVLDWTNMGSTYSYALSNSGAAVKVYSGSDLLASFNVPSDRDGTLWRVFELINGNVYPLNEMDYVYSSGDVTAQPVDKGLPGNLSEYKK